MLRPAPGRWRRSRSIAVGVAAVAAALTAVVVWSPLLDLVGVAGPPSTVAELAAALPSADTLSPALEATWDRHGWPVTRGTGPATAAEQEAAFRIGVRVVELDVALAAGDRPLATRLTHQIEGLLAPLPGADPLRVLYAGDRGVRGRLADGESPAALLTLNRQGDELLPPDEGGDFPGFVDGSWYELGKWAGAARLAAVAGDGGFFASRPNRRFLRNVEADGLPPRVAESIARIRELSAGEPTLRFPEIAEELRILVAVAGGGEEPSPPPR
ncbi:MAG TPA: hypothetical protein VM617_07235 [Thermoanaerobaculia bacterium]|nr:hypothetical protein [Thermoanaerobaculia bacterium]